jgi:lipoprotein-anchoring transpeptidase ErfK/SrfK
LPGAAAGLSPAIAELGAARAVYGNGAAASIPSALPTGPRGDEGVAVIDDRTPAADASKVATSAAGDIHLQFARAFDAAQVQADTGKLAEAHLELSQWYDHPELAPGESRQLIEMLDRLAGTVIYSHRHHLLEKPYQVKPGQTLQQIAEEHQVPWQLLAKVNGLEDPAAIRPGDSLKVLRGPFHAVVDARNLRLTLFLQGRYAGRFPIGLGRDAPAGEGDFEVTGVVDNPIYRGPDMVVQQGDPNNPYGRVWIDLGNQWGIHGTNDPRNVGANTGRGCILLKSQDIAHVQDILSVGSRVIVRR